MVPPKDGAPIVEPSPGGDAPDLTLRALHQRIRQQEILAELGVTALQGATSTSSWPKRPGSPPRRCGPSSACFSNTSHPRTGCWSGPGSAGTGIVGKASIGADLASPAGFALRTGKPVISNHLENEERFRTPEMLQHGIHRAMNVILQGDGRPFGVLEVDSRSEDEFVEQDLAFLQGAANILGMAIEREHHARNLEAALERHQVLLKEMGHRVKNSLMIVTSMLQLQARDIGDPTPHAPSGRGGAARVGRGQGPRSAVPGRRYRADGSRQIRRRRLQGPRRERGPLRHSHRGSARDGVFCRSRHLGGTGRQRADRKRGQARLPGRAGRKGAG